MKVALISLNQSEGDPPLGLPYLASYARKYGGFDDIVIVDKEDPIKRIKKEKPDLIGISAMTYEFPRAKEVAFKIKSNFDIPLIIGGHHISLMPNHFDRNLFDLAIMGEGEQTFLELLQLFEGGGNFPKNKLRKIRGVMYPNNGTIKRTEPRPLIKNLDKIPLPARDLLKMEDYYVTIRKATFGKFGIYLSMLTSRGCPYNCAFCSIAVFWQRARFHSAEYVVNEMKHLIDKYKIDGLIFYDDLFTMNRARLREIVRLLRKEKINEQVEFHVYGRANLINKEICELLKKMGVSVVEFGLESGSEKILKYLKGGTVTVADNRRAIRLCKQFGMKTIGSFIIGSPHETENDLKQTMKLVKDKNLDGVHVYQLTPYPGTRVWEHAKLQGLVSDSKNFNLERIYLRYFKPEMVLTDKISKEKFQQWYYKFQEEVAEKNYRLQAGDVFSRIGPKHIKYFLKPRFIKKFLFHWKEFPSYFKRLEIG